MPKIYIYLFHFNKNNSDEIGIGVVKMYEKLYIVPEVKIQEYKIPDIKMQEFQIREIQIPEIKTRDYTIPEIRKYDPVRDIGMSGHEVLIRYGPSAHQEYKSMTPLMRSGIELARDSIRTTLGTFQTHQ